MFLREIAIFGGFRYLEMSGQIEERRLKGIAKQIGLLKSQIRDTNKKSMVRFLLGLTLGLLANILIELLSF